MFVMAVNDLRERWVGSIHPNNKGRSRSEWKAARTTAELGEAASNIWTPQLHESVCGAPLPDFSPDGDAGGAVGVLGHCRTQICWILRKPSS